MENNTSLFLVAQKDMDLDDPTRKDLYNYGVVAEIKQALRVSDDLVKVLVEGKFRASLIELDNANNFMQVLVKPAPVRGAKSADSVQAEALLRSIREAFEEYMELSSRIPKDVVYTILSSEDPVFLGDYIPAIFFLSTPTTENPERGNGSGPSGNHSVGIQQGKQGPLDRKEIHDKVSVQMDKNQRDYFLREQMRAISTSWMRMRMSVRKPTATSSGLKNWFFRMRRGRN